MKQAYKSFSRGLFAVILLLLSSQTAKASHALPLVGLNGAVGPTGITISGASDGATCQGTASTPYWMQVEITCNPAGFSGNPPASNSPLWGTPPWYHSILNLPGYGPVTFTETCVLEPYVDIFIPFSALCPGTTYYWRAREFCEPTNSVAAWMGPFSFVTPGLPPSAILSSTASQNVVCPGDTVQLDAQISGGCPGATFTYSWSPTTGLSNPAIANPTAIITNAINYTVTVTGGCFTITSNDDTVIIGLGPNVAPGVATASPTSLCSGASSLVVLTGMGTNNIQWQVSPNGTTWFNIPGATDDTLNTGPLTSSLYYQAIVTGDGWPGAGCGTAASPPVLVNVFTSPIANAGANSTICSGSCTNLTGTGGVTYSWQPGNLSGSNISVCPTSNTTYSLTITDANGCTATDNVQVSISNANVTASPDISICNSGTTILFASGSPGNTYNWTPSATLVGANTANPSATPSVTTNYTVTATNSFGCTAVDSILVTVTPAPPITLSADTSLCAGGNATLVASGATSYNWQPGNLSGPSVTVNPSSTQTYTVTGTSSNCISIDSVVVNISPPPFVFAGPDFDVCNGSQATMNVATTGTSYAWTPTTGIIGSTTSQSVVAAPIANTSYTVTVTGPGGCISTDTINVTVNPIPNVTASSPDNTICVGLSTTVNAAGASTYAWLPAVGLSNPIGSSSSANPSSTTTYQVVGTDANGCMDTASITIIVNPEPSVYITSTPTECGDTTGTMIFNGVVTGTSPFTYTVNSTVYPSLPINNLVAGSYTVATTDANGCVGWQVVTVGMQNTSFINASANPSFGVYPLPVGFNSTGSNGLNNWSWNFGDGLGSASTSNPSYVYNSPGTYTVVVSAWNDWFGCIVYDTITVQVVDEAIVDLPNVFTPNGDLTNDGFSASISGVSDLQVTVYNRWGKRVFEGSHNGLASSPQVLELWDGKGPNGNVCDDGVYYYVVTAIGFDTLNYEFAGFVQLIQSK